MQNRNSFYFLPKFASSLFLILIASFVYSQSDTLILNNGNVIIGEIKSMDRGVLIIETDYSKKDFQIEWSGIRELYTHNYFLLTLSDGSIIKGSFRSTEDQKLKLEGDQGGIMYVPKEKLVYIKELEKGFFSRLYARIDLGYSLTKANNLNQFTLDSRLGYLHDSWSLDGYFNVLISSQDSIATIQRKDAGIGYKYLLFKGWYILLDVTFLSNTEQALDLRTNGKAGLGKFIIKTNRAYWGIIAGAAANIENFSEISETISDDRRSWEGFFGTELNLHDVGDLDVYLNTNAYPSITEDNRWRLDLRLDIKYDLPLDFYIRIGSTVNYDNQPAIEGNEIDYILTNGFGWKW